MTGDPPVTLESLDFEWGDAYLIHYARDHRQDVQDQEMRAAVTRRILVHSTGR